MSFHTRTIDIPTPDPLEGAVWHARAVLEAPTPDGPWTPVFAEGARAIPNTDPPELDSSNLYGLILVTRAQLDPGWYRVQWHDNKQRSFFSNPIQLGGAEWPTLEAPSSAPTSTGSPGSIRR